jgi:hypothetical protein
VSANELLGRIEPWIDELARKWERFFAHDPKVPLPPERERAALERQLRELSRGEPPTAGERFRLEQILHRFSLYNNLWQRQLRDREEARGVQGSAARMTQLNAVGLVSVPVIDEYERLFRSYRDELQKAGRALTVSAERFRKALEAQRQQLEATGAVVEGFEVVSSGGQVKVLARIRRGRSE